MLSFCPTAQVARRWDDEVGSPFEHVFSSGTSSPPFEPGPFYHDFGFRKSFAGVWGPKSLNFYAEQKQEGRELHPNLEQDVHMLGGDLVISTSGKMVLPYYSKARVYSSVKVNTNRHE